MQTKDCGRVDMHRSWTWSIAQWVYVVGEWVIVLYDRNVILKCALLLREAPLTSCFSG